MVINLPSALALSGLLAMNTINTGLITQNSLNAAPTQVLASHSMPLNDRYPIESVNTVFKDNILLNLAYLSSDVTSKSDIDWTKVESENEFQITLKPGETFAYHDNLLPKYVTKPAVLGDSHFNATDGYKTDGYLYGDGVCHLASLFNWAASDAGLQVNAPTNHDFMPIPDIPKAYGTAIYYMPGNSNTNAKENLYITNNKDKNVIFNIDYNTDHVTVSVLEQ